MPQTAPINLNALVTERTVTLDGQAITVKPITARVITLMRGEGDNFDKLIAAVPLVAPSLTHEQVLDLTPDQLSAILTLAQDAVGAVEAAAPNGDAPTTTDTPTSSPA